VSLSVDKCDLESIGIDSIGFNYYKPIKKFILYIYIYIRYIYMYMYMYMRAQA